MSTNRKHFFHPYNTRSKSRSHKNNLPPEDTKDTPLAEPAAGKIISGLKATLASKKNWVTNMDKLSMLKQKVKALKNMLIVNNFSPLTWNSDLVTANTHVPSCLPLGSLVNFDKEVQDKKEEQKKEKAGGVFKSWISRLSVSGDDPSGHPNIHTVFLKKDEIKSWKHLVKLQDEGELEYLPDFKIGAGEVWFQVDIEHPFVHVIGSFAFNSFNKAYEMILENGNHNQLSNPSFTACKILKRGYALVITIEALEDGFCGIYDAIVVCDDGKLTLMQFYLTGKKVVEGASAFKNPKAGLILYATGMVARLAGDGWNYINPSERVIG